MSEGGPISVPLFLPGLEKTSCHPQSSWPECPFMKDTEHHHLVYMARAGLIHKWSWELLRDLKESRKNLLAVKGKGNKLIFIDGPAECQALCCGAVHFVCVISLIPVLQMVQWELREFA